MEPILLELSAYTQAENVTEPFPDSSLAFSSSKIFKYQWYSKVLTLVFFLVIVSIGYSLWWVYLGGTLFIPTSYLIIILLSIQLSSHTFVFVIFTALCLYLHFNILLLLRILLIRYHRVDSKKKITIQQCLWGLEVDFMTVSLFVFNYFCINRIFGMDY